MSKDIPLYVAVTHTVNSDALTGVQTVVRGLIHGLAQLSRETEFVYWIKEAKTLALLQPERRGRILRVVSDEPVPQLPSPPKTSPKAQRPKRLAWLYRSIIWKRTVHWKRYRKPKAGLHLHPLHREKVQGSWLLLPEVMYGREVTDVIAYARRHGMRVAWVFHDAIPVSHPELVRTEAAMHHAEYMRALCAADLIFPVSDSSREDFRKFARDQELNCPPLQTCRLAAEIMDQPRAAPKASEPTEEVHALCVSTLEPRKNHLTLLEAFARASERAPNLRLHLAGDRYRDAEQLAEAVQAAARQNPKLVWHGRVSREELQALYVSCDFTVYPSFLEGFGLPVLESLWQRRPCICANTGPMAESAADGGCLATDVRDPAALSDALVSLASQPDLRRELAAETEDRKFRTWREYAAEIRLALAAAHRA
jgi:glycosyltransferase involved in cell wall biosynthesis